MFIDSLFVLSVDVKNDGSWWAERQTFMDGSSIYSNCARRKYSYFPDLIAVLAARQIAGHFRKTRSRCINLTWTPIGIRSVSWPFFHLLYPCSTMYSWHRSAASVRGANGLEMGTQNFRRERSCLHYNLIVQRDTIGYLKFGKRLP